MAISKTKRTASSPNKSGGESPLHPSTGSLAGMDDSSITNQNAVAFSPSGSSHSSQAWSERERRRNRIKRKQTRAKQLRMVCGLGIGLTALFLVVVHVEVSMLMSATSAKEKALSMSGVNPSKMQPKTEPRRILAHHEATPVVDRNSHKNEEHDEKIGFQGHAHTTLHTDRPPKKESKRAVQGVYVNTHYKTINQQHHHEQHQKTPVPNEPHHQDSKTTKKQVSSKEHAKAATQQEEVEKLQKDIEMLQLKKDIATLQEKQQKENNDNNNDAAEAKPQEEKKETEKPEDMEENPAEPVAEEKPEDSTTAPEPPISANFCGDTPTAPENDQTTAPAVIVLGAEDTSTNLFWHVLRGITPEGWVHAPVGVQPAKKPDYNALASMDPDKESQFFKDLKEAPGHHGEWITRSLCLQQQHATVFKKPQVLGFPWLTVGDVALHTRAEEALKSIKKLPTGAVKVIRLRRNAKDVAHRQRLELKRLHKNETMVDPYKVKNQQMLVDELLEKEGIPHIVLDHEKLFPFASWKEMSLSIAAVSSDPINARDSAAAKEDDIQSQWERVLTFMENNHPTSLQGIFSAAEDFDQRAGVFWGKAKEMAAAAEEKKPEAKAAEEKKESTAEEQPEAKTPENKNETEEKPAENAEEKEENSEKPNAEEQKETNDTPEVEAKPQEGDKEPAETKTKAKEEEQKKENDFPPAEEKPQEKKEVETPKEEKKPEEKKGIIEKTAEAQDKSNELDELATSTANFCGTPSAAEGDNITTPAIIILGMEDTSTDLFWHVIRGITPEGWVHAPVGMQPPKKPGYDALNIMDPAKEEEFFKGLKEAPEHHGEWIQQSLCLQQQHAAVFKKPQVLGFPWLTLNDVALHTRAQEALKSIKKLPPGSAKVIRLRRNVNDVAHRQEQEFKRLKKPDTKVDAYKIKNQQQLVDDLLEKEKIPHIVLEHEKLFPFHAWKEMTDLTSWIETSSVPINSNVDRTTSGQQAEIEHEWESVLKFMKNSHPTSLYDIFNAAKDFDKRGGVFRGKAKEGEKKPELTEKDTPAIQQQRKLDPAEVEAEKNKKHARDMLKMDQQGKIDLTPEQIKVFKEAAGEDKEPAKVEHDDTDPRLIKAVNDAIALAEAMPSPMSANFCGNPSQYRKRAVNPAVIVLGMEDSSTDLFWQVLRGITPEGWIHEPQGLQPPVKPKYDVLNSMDPGKEDEFFKHFAISNHGKWVKDSFCLQQQHAMSFKKPTVLGFPWLTVGDIMSHTRAVEAIKNLSKLPKGSVKVIRYRRNILDLASRREQFLMELKEHQLPGSVTLDAKKLLKQLTTLQKQQTEVDTMLESSGIAHLTLDHEMLFPFNNWKEMLNVTSQVEAFPLPLNINVDYSKVPPDVRPPEPSEVEKEWKKVLQFMSNNSPTSLYDIFSAARPFDRSDSVFWRQQNRIKNYPKVEQVVTGTHFSKLLRNFEYKHDYYGCACNDKEANKKKMAMWMKGVKKVKK